MKVYFYEENTKEYTGEAAAQLDPLESQVQGKKVYLLPANATFTAPIKTKKGFAQIYNGADWEHTEDHRGEAYWLPEDEYGSPARVMQELGPLPEGASLTAPVKSFDQVKAEKITELKAIRDRLELEPVEYNGNAYDYDSKAKDRINAAIINLELTGSAISWTTADNTDVEVTADDLRHVIANAAVRSNELHVKYRSLRVLVDQAATVEDLNTIIWE